MFEGTFTYKIGFGSYKDASRENWTFLEVNEFLASQEVAEIARARAGAESASVFTYNQLGQRVYWRGTRGDWGGGGSSVPLNTAREAQQWYEKAMMDLAVKHASVEMFVKEKLDKRWTRQDRVEYFHTREEHDHD